MEDGQPIVRHAVEIAPAIVRVGNSTFLHTVSFTRVAEVKATCCVSYWSTFLSLEVKDFLISTSIAYRMTYMFAMVESLAVVWVGYQGACYGRRLGQHVNSYT